VTSDFVWIESDEEFFRPKKTDQQWNGLTIWF
jgi:hypothetical protein